MAKRKTLPKDFAQIVESGNPEQIKEVFEKCDVNAYENYSKVTALGSDLPAEVMEWLVQNGADVNFPDRYGNTPLHHHARAYKNNMKTLIRLGADIEAKNTYRETPLFTAAAACLPENVRILVEAGAKVNRKDNMGRTPLLYALSRASNSSIPQLVAVSEYLLAHRARLTGMEKEQVKRIGTDFEWFRDRMSSETVAELEPALMELYEMFGVEPVAKRKMYDGHSDIKVTKSSWQEQFDQLWDLLVPSCGAASTVQGEAVRVCGRLAYELLDNGGINWDDDFQTMAESLTSYLVQGEPLDESERAEAGKIIAGITRAGLIRGGEDALARLTELTVRWVLKNPGPLALKETSYMR